MGYKDKHPFSYHRLKASFSFAIQGLLHAFKTEKNIHVHVLAGIIAVLCGVIFRINRYEWLFLVICIFGMFVLELINSAIERTVDLVTDKFKPLAQQAKDLAAGAVLVYAIMTVVIGLIIFLPKLLSFFW